MSYEDQRQIADKYMGVIRPLIEKCVRQTITISVADPENDMKFATDYVVKTDGVSIGCRTLNIENFLKYPNFTIRSALKSGCKTELHKVKEGYPRWYFLGWHEAITKKVDLWVFIDMDKFRKTSINNPVIVDKWNDDGGSAFNTYNINDMLNDGCIKEMSDCMKSYLKTYDKPYNKHLFIRIVY